MKVISTSLAGCVIVEPKVFGDHRGIFFEAFNSTRQPDPNAPISAHQINVSHSTRGVLRGLHYQWPQPQGKLVWVLQGEVFDVAVDLRRHSKTFGQWEGGLLSGANRRQLWIPEGFAHGFQVVSESATFCYLCTRPYQADFDRAIHYADTQIAVEWPDARNAILSDKDKIAPQFADLPNMLANDENTGDR